MKKICKNCLFWDQIHNYNYGQCLCPKIIDVSTHRISHYGLSDHACISDDDGWAAEFIPGEEFGCIHFKSKDKI